MDALASLRFSMNCLGFRENGGKLGAQVYVYMLVQSVMAVNIGCFLVDRWDVVEDRIMALKTIVFLFTYLLYSVTLIIYWEHFSSVIALFYRTNGAVPFPMSTRRQTLLRMVDLRMQKMNKTWWSIIVVYLTPFNVIPIMTVIIKVFVLGEQFQKVIMQSMSAPFPLYYPRLVKNSGDKEWLLNIVVYVMGYALHSTYMLFAGVYAHLAHVTTLCAMSDVQFDLQLLRLSLAEMDDVTRCYSSSNNNQSLQLELSLKRFLNYFIRHHQNIYRRFGVVSVGIRWIAATVCATTSLFMCMSIYTIVQKEQLVVKLQEALFAALWAFGIYLFDVYGEAIQTQDENLRNALYECSWTDKPVWFKKALLLAMVRNTKPIHITPFGLFAFNLNSFAKTMNAAYSYYNLLHNFKK